MHRDRGKWMMAMKTRRTRWIDHDGYLIPEIKTIGNIRFSEGDIPFSYKMPGN